MLHCHENYIAQHIIMTDKILVHEKGGKSFVNAFMAKDTRGMRKMSDQNAVALPDLIYQRLESRHFMNVPL